MRKNKVFAAILCMGLFIFAGCGAGGSPTNANGVDERTLDEIRQAAEDAEYETQSGYASFQKNLVGGFSVILKLNEGTARVSIIECIDTETATLHAEEMDAQNQYSAKSNGKFFTFYDVNSSEEEIKMLESILAGDPIDPLEVSRSAPVPTQSTNPATGDQSEDEQEEDAQEEEDDRE